MSGYSGGYTSHSLNDVDVQPVSITSIDLANNIASGMTRNRTVVSIDISHHVGAIQVTPSLGDQWYVEKHRGIYRLKSQIPFNNIATTIVPTQGQTQLGSGTGPVQLHGTQINSNGPLRLSSGNSPLPAPTTVDAGSLMYDPVQQKPVFSDGSSWTALGSRITPYDINYVQTTTTRTVGYGTNPMGFLVQRQVQFTSVTFRCGTADVSGNLVVELRHNGVTIAGTSTTISFSNQVAGVTVNGSWAFGLGDILTVYITAVGGTPGIGLSADLIGVLVSAASGGQTLSVTATPIADVTTGALVIGLLPVGMQPLAAVKHTGTLSASVPITAVPSATIWNLNSRGNASMPLTASPTAGLIRAVGYDATGAGYNGTGATPSWSHTIGATANCLITIVNSVNITAPTSAAVGTQAMTLLGQSALYDSGRGIVYIFGLLNPPTGAQTVKVTFSGGDYRAACSVSYKEVSGFGAFTTVNGGGTANPSQTLSSTGGERIVQAFSGNHNSFTPYTKTQRHNFVFTSAVNLALVIGDALGAPSVTFDCTAAADWWAGVAINLQPVSP